jgi:hypothetical protein
MARPLQCWPDMIPTNGIGIDLTASVSLLPVLLGAVLVAGLLLACAALDGLRARRHRRIPDRVARSLDPRRAAVRGVVLPPFMASSTRHERPLPSVGETWG